VNQSNGYKGHEPCLDDLVQDPARAGLLSSEERQALLAQVVAFSDPARGGLPSSEERQALVAGFTEPANHTLRSGKRG